MSAPALLIGLILGAVLGAALVAARAARQSATLRAELAASIAREEAQAERLATERATLYETLERISSQMVIDGTDRLAALASERFDQATTALKGDLDVRDARLKGQVDPIARMLERYQEALSKIETDRVGAYQGLVEQVAQLRTSGDGLLRETRSLVTALRAPHTRGKWGEMQLRRVVEMAGMVEHCDFDEQSSTTSDDGILRPDMTVLMPGGRTVVVDAKVPLDAYLQGLDATDEAERLVALDGHARQLKVHIDTLSRKAYWNQFERSPDFVVCFIPGEGLLAAAFEADPGIVERAMESKVLLASPVTLVALLRTIGFGWREEAMAESAAKVQELGQQLYSRLATMGDHLAKLGRSLGSTVEDYNKVVSSAERRVFVTARRFQELGTVGDGQAAIPDLPPVAAIPTGPSVPEIPSPRGETV